MPEHRPVALFTRKHLPSPALLDELRDAGLEPVHGSLESTGASLTSVRVLFPGLERVERPVLEQFPNLGLVALPATGTDSVDLEAAADLGIAVTHVPHQATEEVATHALALMLALLRNVPMYDADMKRGVWQSPENIVTPSRTSRMTLGVVGAGRIGTELVRIATPLFGEVIAFDPYLSSGGRNGDELTLVDSISELAYRADVLSLHVPRTPETERLMSEIDFARARTRYLINVSRGGLVEHAELLQHLANGHLDGVGLDAFDPEPPRADDPLLSHPRVIGTPHRAFESVQSWEAYATYPIRNAIAFMRGEELPSPVGEPPRKGDRA